MCESLILSELIDPTRSEKRFKQKLLESLGGASRKFRFNHAALITAISLFLSGGAAAGREKNRSERVGKRFKVLQKLLRL